MLSDVLTRLSKRRRALPCPACGRWIPRSPLLLEPFTCPGCGRKLQAQRGGSRLWLDLLLSGLIAILVPYAAGIRGVFLAIGALVAFFPALFLVSSETATLFGRLEVCRSEPLQPVSHLEILGLSAGDRPQPPHPKKDDGPDGGTQ